MKRREWRIAGAGRTNSLLLSVFLSVRAYLPFGTSDFPHHHVDAQRGNQNDSVGAFMRMWNTISQTFLGRDPKMLGPKKTLGNRPLPKIVGASESRYLLQTVCEELSVREDHWRYSRYKQGVALKLKDCLPTELVHKSAGPIYSRLQKGANVIPHFVVADFCLRKSSCPVNLGHVWRLF